MVLQGLLMATCLNLATHVRLKITKRSANPAAQFKIGSMVFFKPGAESFPCIQFEIPTIFVFAI